MCGNFGINPPTFLVDCWQPYLNQPHLITTNCSSGFQYSVSSSWGTVVPLPSPNSKSFALRYFGGGGTEVIKNQLNAPLIPNQAYQISAWAINYKNSASSNTIINPYSSPIVLTIASHTNFAATATVAFPTGLNILAQFTIAPGTTWNQYTNTFTYTPTTNANAIYVGIDVLNTPTLPTGPYYVTWLDQVSIIPVSGPTFGIASNTICSSGSLYDLGQYANVNGTFSGPGVAFNGTVYTFNSPSTLTPGLYSIGFTYSQTVNSGTCNNTINVPIYVENCCTSTLVPSLTSTLVANSTTLSGPLRITNDFTIQGSVSLIGEFLISPNVQITIDNGASVQISNTHMYGCLDMWEGILVHDGGQLKIENNTLIEDAKSAVKIVSYTSTLSPILNITNTTFNKNYISIFISDCQFLGSSSLPFIFTNNVFTCRNLPFTSTSWPSPSTTDLRSTTSGLNVLSSPFTFQNYSECFLKSPYSSDYSRSAFKITNVGNIDYTLSPGVFSYGFSSIKIGTVAATNPSNDFNLFDAHQNFVESDNSNIKIENCIFQNTKIYFGTPFIVPCPPCYFGPQPLTRAAIDFSCGLENRRLDLSVSIPAAINRFYNCHNAIKTIDAMELDVENCTFRSTQASTALASVSLAPVGNSAIRIISNRFFNYKIENNEFSNINNCVTISSQPSPLFLPQNSNQLPVSNYTSWPWPNQIFLQDIVVRSNTFSPEMNTSFTNATTGYLNNGVSINSPINYTIWANGGNGIIIDDNIFYRVYHPVSLWDMNSIGIPSHVDGPYKSISNNTIFVEPDIVFNTTQHAIELVNHEGTILPLSSYLIPLVQTIERNTAQVFASSPLTHTNISLIFGENNIGFQHPAFYAICNTVTACYSGFKFSGTNNKAYWRGNDMSNLSRGLFLYMFGIIGQQGSVNGPSDNKWTGSWTSLNGTYTHSSTASSSSIFRRTSPSYFDPPNNNGFPLISSFNSSGINLATSGSYTCGGPYAQLITPNISLPNWEDYPTVDQLYIAQHVLFRYLNLSDSLREAEPLYNDFYSSLVSTSHLSFVNIERALSSGNFTAGATELYTMNSSTFNTVEYNYYHFFDLYLKFMTNPASFGENEYLELIDLASKCPSVEGEAVYKARSLFQLITGNPFRVAECNDLEQEMKIGSSIQQAEKHYLIQCFPNPAMDHFTIRSPSKSNTINLRIIDLLGKVVLEKKLNITEFETTISIDLINGAYTVFLQNGNGIVVNKLIIAK